MRALFQGLVIAAFMMMVLPSFAIAESPGTTIAHRQCGPKTNPSVTNVAQCQGCCNGLTSGGDLIDCHTHCGRMIYSSMSVEEAD